MCRDRGLKKRAVVHLRHHRLSLCEEHFLIWFERRIERTIKEFKMIEPGEKVLVAVSGGKDSIALWYVLDKLGYETGGLYIDMGIGEGSGGYSSLSKNVCGGFADKIGRPLHIVSVEKEFGKPLPLLMEHTGRPACSLCSTIKRYYMNRAAKEYGYDVVATGHNLDDEAAVLLGNTVNWEVEYLRRQYPVLPGGDGFVKKVKPMCKVTEKESALYMLLKGIDYVREECPYSVGATTIKNKELLIEMEEKSPGFRIRFYTSFLKKMYPVLATLSKTTDISGGHGHGSHAPLSRCKICGEPSSADVCPVCRLRYKTGAQN